MSLRERARSALGALEALGRVRQRREYRGSMGTTLALADGRTVHNFSSNDYLGLAAHPRLREWVANADDGIGAGASRLIVSPEVHGALEGALAKWLGCEAGLLFNSGYAANVGILSVLGGEGVTVFSDALNHASIIDGCRLGRGRVVVFPHCDMGWLEGALASDASPHKVVVSESIFSMDGDVADVVALRSLADRYGAALVVDEAHALGVVGPQGRGVCASARVRADLVVGTLGKAFGSFGAFVVGDELVLRWLWNRARSLVFSTGLPPGISHAGLAALNIIAGSEGDALRERLVQNQEVLASALDRDVNSHIVPWVVGEDRLAVGLSCALLDAGYFVQAIRPPTVPEGTARLRIALGVHDPGVVVGLSAALRTVQSPR